MRTYQVNGMDPNVHIEILPKKQRYSLFVISFKVPEIFEPQMTHNYQ